MARGAGGGDKRDPGGLRGVAELGALTAWKSDVRRRGREGREWDRPAEA